MTATEREHVRPPAHFRVFEHTGERYTPWRRFARGFLLRTLAAHLIMRVEVRGLEHIPPSGPTLIMMNHTGGADPMVIMGAVTPRFVAAMSKIENFSVPLLGPLMRLWGVYPVTRGAVDRRALEYTIRLLEHGELVLMAPEGTRQPKLIEAKDGLTYLALKTNAAIVPVALEGTRDLVPNLKRLRRSPITVTFGRAFRFRVSDTGRVSGSGRVPRADMARMTQEAMYQLAALVSKPRRGFYADLSKTTTETLDFID